MPTSPAAAAYDGTAPFPGIDDAGPRTTAGRVQVGVTVAFVLGPFVGLAAAKDGRGYWLVAPST